MPELTLDFSQIRKADVPSAGGKGANLGELTAAGLAVPEGFVVTAEAYRLFMRENGLEAAVRGLPADDDPAGLAAAAKTIREQILRGSLPEPVRNGLAAAYAGLGPNARVAVRSSATAEDLPEASFAGQQETFLNVRGEAAVMDAVRRCYASLWGDRAVSYRRHQGYDQQSVALAVVIQRMVESEKAGVLFTANPVNNSREEMQVNAAYGLGESVVSGRVTADTLVCGRDGRVISRTLGSKAVRVVYAEEGTQTLTVSPEEQAAWCLTDAELSALCAEAVKVEDHYGMPMDIEWAVAGGRVYILQARAVTTLKESGISEEEILAYTRRNRVSGMARSNLAFLLEKMPVALTPLDHAMCGAINNQKAAIFSEAGLIMSMEPVMDDDGVMILPPNGKRITGKITHLPAIIRELKDFGRCRKELDAFFAEERPKPAAWETMEVDAMPPEACGRQLRALYDEVCHIAYVRFRKAMFPAFFFQGRLKRKLAKADPTLTAYDLYSNLDYRTAVQARDLTAMARQLAGDAEISAAIRDGMDAAALRARFPAFDALMAAFLQKHGYTLDMNCCCLISRSFNEEPDRVVSILRPLLAQGELPETDRFGGIMDRLKAAYGKQEYARLAEDIRLFRSFHVDREESQYLWETAFTHIRRLLRRIALLLTGDADYMRSVACLFMDELTAACERGSLSDADREKIARRKAKRPLAEKVWERCRLDVFPPAGDTLRGIGGSTGTIVGRACIIHGPEEFHKLRKGDVLVCPLTDPEWTPLFGLASAVVADTGAALSHAAIVAREYGIPAVLGVGLATSRYRDGDMLRVDGTRGEVGRAG